ncbi:UNVERIFIED_CONTAM: Retrovirus-related Pol polyprotein from transposon RE2 [Sesamum indicum]
MEPTLMVSENLKIQGSDHPGMGLEQSKNWDSLTVPTRKAKEGGLGLKDVGTLNRALMCKKLCEVIRCDRTSIWVEWLRHGRLRDDSIWTIPENRGPWGWRKMLRLRGWLRSVVEYRIGDGSNFFLWKDPWHHLGPSLTDFRGDPTHWPLITDMECVEITHVLPRIHGGTDRIIWKGSSGKPTTQEFYRAMIPAGLKVGWISLLSGSLKIPRHLFILWLAILEKLATTDKPWLSHLGCCVLCNEDMVESHNHLFFHCRFSRRCLSSIRRIVRFQWPNRDWVSDVEWGARKWRGKHIINISYRCLLGSCVYYIWRERNLRRFEHEERPPSVVANLIVEDVRQLYSVLSFLALLAHVPCIDCGVSLGLSREAPNEGHCSKDIAEAFLYAKSARELWLELESRFGESNDPLLYQIQRDIASSSQGNTSIAVYFTKLKRLWDELQSLDPLPTCDCGASKKIAEKTASSQLMQFLMGLSNVYDHVRNQILPMDPLPTVGKAYSMVQRVEKQWEVHLGITAVHKEGIMNVQTEIKRGTFNKGPLKKGNLDKRSLFCEHCKKNGHTKQGCFEINGFPDWYKLLAEQKKKGNKPPNTRALNVNLRNGESSFQETISEIVKTEFKKALQSEESSQYFSNYAESEEFAGMGLKPTIFMNKTENTWVIDSGASAHMCANAALFEFLKPLDDETSIKLRNGIVQKVKLARNIRVTKNIIRIEVLYVPDFKHNLLSVNRLCRDNSFKVTFTKDNCTVQDLQTSRVMAVGRQENRLYILGMDKNKDTDLTNNAEDITKAGNRETHILKVVAIGNLWHSRLGHAGMDHRTTFPTSDSKTENAFDLVHVDVWGPYKEYSISHCHYMLTLVDDYTRATWTYMMIHKSQAQEKLEQFYNLDVTFYETVFPFSQLSNTDTTCPLPNIIPEENHEETETGQEEQDAEISNIDSPIVLRSLTPTHKQTYLVENLCSMQEPKDYKEALERYKARLVAKGYSQKEGEDYGDCFAPVAKAVTVRTFLRVAAARKWHLHHLDVNNAFLHGTLDEEIYMEPPNGYEIPIGKVCKLKKPLYGLKQASRQWNQQFTDKISEFGFIQCAHDHCLFIKHTKSHLIALLVYVDDILVTAPSNDLIMEVKGYLNELFAIKDLGVATYFLGLEIMHSAQGILISQNKYTLDIIRDRGHLRSKATTAPLPAGCKLSMNAGATLQDPSKYRRLIGRLLYLGFTRPDICYAAQQLSQHIQHPCQHHWEAAMHLIKYLKGNPSAGLFFSRDCELELKAFCDAHWVSCLDSRKSLTGYCILLGGSPISWRTKKQTTVARSSAEAEYRSIAATTCEISWVMYLLAHLRVLVHTPIPFYCDKKVALHITANPLFHEQTKHLEIDCHVVRNKYKEGINQPSNIMSKQQVADLFTKVLTGNVFLHLRSKLGMITTYPCLTCEGSVKTYQHQQQEPSDNSSHCITAMEETLSTKGMKNYFPPL